MNISVDRIYKFYCDGFKSMTLGRTLWLIIAIKIVVIFLFVKLFFFPDRLATDYKSDTERAQAVRSALIK